MVCCCFSYSTNTTNGASSEDKSCFRRNIEGTNNGYWLLYQPFYILDVDIDKLLAEEIASCESEPIPPSGMPFIVIQD